MSTNTTVTREIIPESAKVCRLVDFPYMFNDEDQAIIWTNVFAFPRTDECPDGRPESVVWTQYASTDAAVHEIGCSREATSRVVKPNFRYKGFVSAFVHEIRNINIEGHTFKVLHEPDEGIYHAEISYEPKPGTKIPKTIKTNLKATLYKKFGNLVPYSCCS